MLHQNSRLQIVLPGTLLAALALLYAFVYVTAFVAPASGLDYDDAAGPLWLKAIPLAGTFCWLYVVRKLLGMLGAPDAVSWTLCAITAASPSVVYLATHHTREPLFALLATSALLALLSTKPVISGVLTALACAVQSVGIALVIAGIVIFASRRRFRDAVLFAVASMFLAAPALGWKLAHGRAGASILTHLQASEKVAVLGANIGRMWQTPAVLVGVPGSLYSALVFLALLLWALWQRRQLMPDLFVFVYAAMLLLRIWPPERSMVPLFPLLLWMLWRGFRRLRREVLAAVVILLIGLETVSTVRRLVVLRTAGDFPFETQAVADWPAMQKLFDYIRRETLPSSVLVANLNQSFAFNTGRRTLAGYKRDPFEVFYAPKPSPVTPGALGEVLLESGASYVVMTPDRGRPEAPSFRRSVEALERGGVLEPVPVPELPPGYRLLGYVPLIGTVPARNR